MSLFCSESKYISRLPFAFLLLSFLVLPFAACNESFRPLQENNEYFFTITGYLDASADTQWVRVAPAREQLDAPPEVPDTQVTLENMQTGDTVIMNDSLFASGSGFNYINFYTLADIEPGQTYRVEAEYPDGRSSRVTITTPEEFPTPLFLEDRTFFSMPHIHQIIMPGVNKENLIDVQTWWFVYVEESNQIRKFSFSYRNSAQRIETYGGAYLVEVTLEREYEEVSQALNVPTLNGFGVELLHRQVFVAVAGPEWNEEIASLSDLLYTQPEVISNVEDGLGYMVGVYSKIIPYNSCFTEDRDVLIPCELEKPYTHSF